jgi:replication factor A1
MAVVRFGLVVSDGHHYQQVVVVSELHARIESWEVETLGLIKLTEVSCQVVAGRRVIIILGLEVVSCRVAKLGAPSNVDPACAAKSASEASQQGAKPAPAAPPRPTPAVAHAESNVGTNQQPQSAQQPQSLDSDEEKVLRLEEEKAKEVELQIQREAQLMDQ